MRGLADGGVVHVQIAADRADHDLTGVEPDANLSRDPVGAAGLFGPAANRSLHVEGCIAGPDRMILVPEWCAEERHDAVAHDLVDRPLVAVNRFHHPLEDRIQELPGLLGIPVGQQFHRPLQVGEQHRHLLALAFESRLRIEDAFGQVLRGVTLGGAEASGNRGHQRRSSRVGTLRTELGRCGELAAAVCTCPRQGRGALLAELRARLIVALAP